MLYLTPACAARLHTASNFSVLKRLFIVSLSSRFVFINLCLGFIYEPAMSDAEFFNSKVIKDLEEFKSISDVIIANRFENILEDVKDKIYTRDIFNSDS